MELPGERSEIEGVGNVVVVGIDVDVDIEGVITGITDEGVVNDEANLVKESLKEVLMSQNNLLIKKESHILKLERLLDDNLQLIA
eukprot:CAMPEP_0174820904 /NCGR_PEP_ID=MMETSP1107-20130205/5026_1 /TAXON_ID=36770 /ORGANISM="Paraphysomonas vestita, Strain GFlagA" /LENGTH=84 /DNA_ID=CAMNT_0016037133 /DNA_START=168 /DNA_END=423 /DNA_ORIENTATION=+